VVRALPITEIVTTNEFFDFNAKYEGESDEITPAVVEEEIAETIRQTAIKAYHVFNCSGVIRIDFIYNEAVGLPYMLEINTVPGQSDASLVPQQVRAMGWTLTEFYSSLLEECFNNK
jgi:D-alanine-D-alanine ligase